MGLADEIISIQQERIQDWHNGLLTVNQTDDSHTVEIAQSVAPKVSASISTTQIDRSTVTLTPGK